MNIVYHYVHHGDGDSVVSSSLKEMLYLFHVTYITCMGKTGKIS